MKGRRYFVLSFIIAVFVILVFARLFNVQIVKGNEYLEQSNRRVSKTFVVKAPRGEITDRYGKPLIRNRLGFSVEISKEKDTTDEELNFAIASLLYLAKGEDADRVQDTLPISKDDFVFEFNEDAETPGKKEIAWKQKYDFENTASPQEVIEKLAKKYHVDSKYDDQMKRKIVGVRYEMDLRNFSHTNPFEFASDISVNMLSVLKEKAENYPLVTVLSGSVREYTKPGIATHVLGRVGKISSEEYDELKSSGYSMNDTIGKQGIEKYLEEYLRGTDGLETTKRFSEDFTSAGISDIPPVPGNNAVLTIDSSLQEVAENALKNTIMDISGNSTDGKGVDACAGSVVAMDVNTGEILAMASYPTYDMSQFDHLYSDLLKDETRPLINRAVAGTYAPGSVFKMLTSVAALEEHIITEDDYIVDQGVYMYYPDYHPQCWIYAQGDTHGSVNVTEAIAQSCNYFFYDVGRRLTIEKLNYYTKLFGFGETTGVELPGEELKGRVAGPEDREKYPKGEDKTWYPGDTLQAAIGQSDNLFTPIQIANYVATLVNGGNRFQPTLIRSVYDSETGKTIYERPTKPINKIEISEKTRQSVLDGMHMVSSEGTASQIFDDFNIRIGAKTGTAQVSRGTSNGVFVAFGPFEKPQIAISVVIEHGGSGGAAAPVAKAILDAYLNASSTEEDLPIAPDTLLMR